MGVDFRTERHTVHAPSRSRRQRLPGHRPASLAAPETGQRARGGLRRALVGARPRYISTCSSSRSRPFRESTSRSSPPFESYRTVPRSSSFRTVKRPSRGPVCCPQDASASSTSSSPTESSSPPFLPSSTVAPNPCQVDTRADATRSTGSTTSPPSAPPCRIFSTSRDGWRGPTARC